MGFSIMVSKILSKKCNLIFCAISALIFFSISNAESATYYVDANKGNDHNSGTLNSPWASIEKANSTLRAGDTVYLREGDYKEQQIFPKNSGELGRLITYRNYDNEKVTLSGAHIPVYLDNKKYIQIDGFIISDCRHFFVLYNGSSYNIIRNCTFYKAKSYFGSILSKYYRDPQTATINKHFVGASNDYNKILNNVWLDAPDKCSDGPDQNCDTAPADMHYCEKGSYNVYEGNQFGSSSHDNLVLGGGRYAPQYHSE